MKETLPIGLGSLDAWRLTKDVPWPVGPNLCNRFYLHKLASDDLKEAYSQDAAIRVLLKHYGWKL